MRIMMPLIGTTGRQMISDVARAFGKGILTTSAALLATSWLYGIFYITHLLDGSGKWDMIPLPSVLLLVMMMFYPVFSLLHLSDIRHGRKKTRKTPMRDT